MFFPFSISCCKRSEYLISIQRIPQTATLTNIRTPIPTTSDFLKFGFNPAKYEKNQEYQPYALWK